MEGTVVNYDECRVCYSSDGQLVMQWKGKERSNLQGTKSETLCSFLPFVGMDGTVIMSVYILKGKPNDSEDEILARVVLPNEREGKRGSWPRFYAFTETGYINEEVFEKVMHKFIELWKLQHPGLHVYVFGDQLWSHINVSLIKYGIQNGVYLWFFVSNASHFMQPLDSTPNVEFKKNVGSYCGDAVFENLVANADLRSALFAAVYKAERDSYTRAVIKDGFLKTGIFPWDADKIRENARENIQGKIDSKVDAEHRNATEAMTTVLRMYLDKAKETNSSVRSRTSWVGKNGLFDPQQLLEYAEQQEQEKKRIEEEKEEKKDKKHKSRRDKERKPRNNKQKPGENSNATLRGAICITMVERAGYIVLNAIPSSCAQNTRLTCHNMKELMNKPTNTPTYNERCSN